MSADIIATYADGSGAYTITRSGDTMTTAIANGAGVVFESHRHILVRAAEHDSHPHASEYQLAERFASSPDVETREVVWIDGLAYRAIPAPALEHDYVPFPGTEGGEYGPLYCGRCMLPAEGGMSWECREPDPVVAGAFLNRWWTLAVALYGVAYPGEHLDEAEPEIVGNYVNDAREVIEAHHHLLTLPMVEMVFPEDGGWCAECGRTAAQLGRREQLHRERNTEICTTCRAVVSQ